jgi:DNA polymerase-3 subunit beta
MTTATKRRKAAGVTMDRQQLLAALKDVAAAVATRGPKPILTNVLLHDGLLSATDLELRIDCHAEWHDDPLLLPHARLKSILETATGDEVVLTRDGSACRVEIGRSEWRLPVEDAAEFPTWEPGKLSPLPRIPCDQFARAVRSVAYACDTESSRFALGAVQIEVQDGECTLCASDGRRLSVALIEFDQALDPIEVLVPEHAIQQMAAIAMKHKGDGTAVQLQASKSEIVATFDGQTITARLIDGRFPKWRDVFPDRDANEHVVEIGALWSATRAAAIVTTEQSKGVDYTFTADGITLHGQSSESGESKVECEIVSAGNPGTVKLDPRFVSDVCRALSSLDGEPNVRISTAGPGDAVVLTCGEDDEYRSVIMPLDPAG